MLHGRVLVLCVALLALACLAVGEYIVPVQTKSIATDSTAQLPREEKRRLLLLEKTESSSFYRARILVGFPRKPYWVRISTSTSSLLIFDTSVQGGDQPIEEDSFAHTYYELPPNKSPFLKPDKVFKLPFMDGSIYEGEWNEELVEIGGVKWQDMGLGIVKTIAPGSTTREMDGVLGLGLSRHRQESRDLETPLSRLVRKKKTKFSFFLSKGGKEGLLTLGYTDPALYVPTTLRFVPVVPGEPSWTVRMGTLQLGNTEDTNKKNTKIVDLIKKGSGGVNIEVNIGSNYLWAPRTVVNKLVKLIHAARWNEDNSRVVLDDCSSRESLPQLVFNFDNRKYAFHGTEYFEEVPLPPEVIAIVTKKLTTMPQCQLIILPSEESDKTQQWSLGIPFFKKFYTSFDYQKQAVGFAVAVDELPEDDEDIIQKERDKWNCWDMCGKWWGTGPNEMNEEVCDKCME